MKNIYFFPRFIFFWDYSTGLSQNNPACQDCGLKGITTNPDGPINTERPPFTNNFFDWREPVYQANSIYVALSTIQSPFSTFQNPLVSHFYFFNELHRPEDGWELLKHDLGFTINGNPNTTDYVFLVLYNKFTGTLRVFLAGDDPQSFSGARIIIKFDNAISTVASSVISNASTLFALDNFEPNPSISSVTRFINGINNWFYADFSLSYDPCSCYFDSSLRIEAELLSNADIFLSGKLSGEIASINNNNSGNGVSHDGFASRLTTSAKTAQKAYKNVQGWVSDQVKQSLVNAPGASQSLQINFSDVYSTSVNVIQNHIVNDLATPEAISYIQNTHAENTQNIGFLQNLLNSSTFLKSGLKAVPFVGAALQFVNAFVSGGRKGSSTQTVQVMPMAINADLELGGTLSISKLYKGISFVTPGSLNSACSPDGFYPYYNEVLGVLNLLRTPEIRFRHQYFLTEDIDEFGPYFRERSYWQVQLTNLQYVLNPAARLRSDNIEILGSLQFKYTANGEVAYATSFVPIQTLLNAQVEFGTDVEQGPFSSFNEILGCFHDFPPS
jgi:hypothetical protein